MKEYRETQKKNKNDRKLFNFKFAFSQSHKNCAQSKMAIVLNFNKIKQVFSGHKSTIEITRFESAAGQQVTAFAMIIFVIIEAIYTTLFRHQRGGHYFIDPK